MKTKIENAKVVVINLRQKKGTFFPATVDVQYIAGGFVLTQRASAKFPNRLKAGTIMDVKSLTLEEYDAQGAHEGKVFHRIEHVEA